MKIQFLSSVDYLLSQLAFSFIWCVFLLVSTFHLAKANLLFD